jgi:hypothetical protein
MLYLALFVPVGEPPLPRSVLADPAIARYVDGWGTRKGDSGLIAVVGGAPVGAAWLRCFQAPEPGYGFVEESTPELSIAVLPAHRAKGIGSHLWMNCFGASSQRRSVAIPQIQHGDCMSASASCHCQMAGPCCVRTKQRHLLLERRTAVLRYCRLNCLATRHHLRLRPGRAVRHERRGGLVTRSRPKGSSVLP